MRDWSGLLSGIAAFGLWGVFPVYFKWIAEVPAAEVLAHRIVWSVVFLVAGLKLLGRSIALKKLFVDRKLFAYLSLSAALIAFNWLIFIEAIANGQTIEASFGYFMNPILIIALGVIVFRERLNLSQKICLALAIIAVIYQIISLRIIPWISLSLAASFALYGMVRKKAKIDSIRGLLIETLIMSPIALIYLGIRYNEGSLYFANHGWQILLLLLCAGLVTSVPLILFAVAVRRLPYATMGFLQFIAPSLQFIIAVFYFQETLQVEKLNSFILVWLGLAVLLFGPKIEKFWTRSDSQVTPPS